MTLEAVQKDVESQVQQMQVVSVEVERLKEMLASEKKNVSETSMELQALKKELERSKSEAEKLKSFEDRNYSRSRSRIELEDAKNTIDELKEELAYKSNVNRSLGLQLEKTIESNSELLLEIKELDEVIQKRETEIEELKGELEGRQGGQELEDEKARWMQKLEESEQERNKLEKAMLEKDNQADTQELQADNELLRKELEKVETGLAEASKENMNLLSQLMDLRHQTDEKEAMSKQLFFQLTELQEKLHLSEELSQSQLNSNKVFLDDLNATVEGLRARNEQLEFSIKSSEERNASLCEELEAQQKEIVEHEKERSLLVSQRGQLKILREKMATITENYELAVKRCDDLDLANTALREETQKSLSDLSEQVKDIEHKLHESNAECFTLRETCKKLPELEAMASALQEKLRFLQEERESQDSCIANMELELQCTKENLDASKEALSASESRMQNLQMQNDELAEMLGSAMSFKEEVVSRLEAANTKEAEMDHKLQTTAQALEQAKSEKAVSDQALVGLQDRVRQLDDEKNMFITGQENLQAQLDALKVSIADMMLEKEKAEKSLQELQIENACLAQDLPRWKVKGKAGMETPTKKDKDKARMQNNRFLNEKETHLLQDGGSKGVKKGIDVDHKGDMMKLRKSAAELRRKLTEEQEEKEDMRKKLALVQKEAQRKSDLLLLCERKLKEKEKEQHTSSQRPPTRGSSTVSRTRIGVTNSSMPNGGKAMADLLEKIKLLEGELNIRTVELEATRFVLKEKEAALSAVELNMESENFVDDHAHMHQRGAPSKLENQESISNEYGHLINAGSQDASKADVRRLQKENKQQRNSLLKQNGESKTFKSVLGDPSEIHMGNNGPQQSVSVEQEAAKEESTHLQEELSEMRERYSQMSLQCAELQVEREELLVTIRKLSRESHE